MDDFKPDVIHCHDWQTGGLADRAGYGLNADNHINSHSGNGAPALQAVPLPGIKKSSVPAPAGSKLLIIIRKIHNQYQISNKKKVMPKEVV